MELQKELGVHNQTPGRTFRNRGGAAAGFPAMGIAGSEVRVGKS